MCYFWKVNIITLNIQLSGPSSKVDYSITGWDMCFGCQLSIHMLSGLTFRCTPAWLLTHNVFMFLPRTCVHSRLEVPRNYTLPTNSLTPFAAAPQTSEWVLMRDGSRTFQLQWFWGTRLTLIPRVPQLIYVPVAKMVTCMMMQALLASFLPLTDFSTSLSELPELSSVIRYFTWLFVSGFFFWVNSNGHRNGHMTRSLQNNVLSAIKKLRMVNYRNT